MPCIHTIEGPTLDAARRRLSRFVEMEADQTADYVGFGWEASEEGPNSYTALAEAYEHSWETGKSLPVSTAFSDRTVYVTPLVNLQMRFWHDVAHARTGRTFNGPDELQLAEYHLEAAWRAGFTRNSLEYRLFYADTVGQARCRMIAGKFPDDQLAFALRSIKHGVVAAIDYEVRLIRDSQPNDAA